MRVAVEANLSPVSDYLSRQGYQVESLDQANLTNKTSEYAAVVVSGADENLMGIQTIQVNCPVINAHGLTPEEIHNRIQKTVH